MPDERGRVHYIKLLTEPTEEQKEIYEKLKINALPLRARHIIVGEMECRKKNGVNTKLFQKKC